MSHSAPPIRTRRPAPTTKQKMSTGAKIATTLLVVVVTVAVAIAATVGYLLTRVSSSYERHTEVIPNAFPENRPEEREDDGETILLLGSDTRGELDTEDIDASQDGRSDTMMLAHIPHDHDAVYFVSIMRDSWVDIPGHGMAKINAAMAYGGVPLTIEVVEDLIGSRVDEVAMVDFTGFEGLTNALGGVTVTNTVAFQSGGHNFPAGDIKLNGEEALTFVRTRKAFEDGDYQRVRNQQAWVRGIAREMISTKTITNPARIIDVVDAIAPYMAVTPGLDTAYILNTAAGLRNVRTSDLYFMSVPTSGPAWEDGQSVILLDDEGVAELREAFETDTLGAYYNAHY